MPHILFILAVNLLLISISVFSKPCILFRVTGSCQNEALECNREISQINIPTPTDNIDTISLYLNFLSAKNRENCKNNIYIFFKKNDVCVAFALSGLSNFTNKLQHECYLLLVASKTAFLKQTSLLDS